MTDPKPQQPLPPREAVDELIRRAMDPADQDGGAFRAAYNGWKTSETNRIIKERANGIDAVMIQIANDPKQRQEIEQDIVASAPEKFAKFAKDTWNEAQSNKDKANLNISGENAPGFFMQLFSNPGGAIMSLLMEMQPVKQLFASVITMVASWFTGNKLNMSEARAQVETNHSLSAGAEALAKAGFGDATEIASALANTRAPGQSGERAASAGMPANVPKLTVMPGTGVEQASNDFDKKSTLAVAKPGASQTSATIS